MVFFNICVRRSFSGTAATREATHARIGRGVFHTSITMSQNQATSVPSNDELEHFNKSQLLSFLKSRGVKQSGNKAEAAEAAEATDAMNLADAAA